VNYFPIGVREFLSSGRTFNTSVAKVSPGKFLYAVRFFIPFISENDKLVPGNVGSCPNLGPDEVPGRNFWWHNWNNVRFGLVLFFIGNHMNDDLRYIKCFDHLKHNPPGYLNEREGYSDVRIFNYRDKIYLYTSNLRFFSELEVTDVVRMKMAEDVSNIAKSGHNFSIFKIEDVEATEKSEDYKKVFFFDWFYVEGIRILEGTTKFASTSNVALTILSNPKYPLVGTGSYYYHDSNYDIIDYHLVEPYKKQYGVMPMFSFSTPSVEIRPNVYLGVGHIKLHADKLQYLPDTNIEHFVKKLHEQMRQNYGDRYVRHRGGNARRPFSEGECRGYIYMMYFYIFDYDRWSFKMSDFYLPLYLDSKPVTEVDRDYKFALVFPMGLVTEGDSVMVTAGEGDFYSTAMTFSLENIIANCIHSSVAYDLRTAGYYILGYGQNTTFIGENVNSVIEALKLS
jgi:hypothetical protein